MAPRLSLEQLRLIRMRAQRLHPKAAAASVDALLQGVCSLQAQELAAAHLAVRARSGGLRLEHVRRAREVERTLALTWCMRGTLHLVAAEDLAWLLPFCGPLYIHKGQRRYKELGLDAQTRAKAAEIMRDVLHERGPLTRPELAQLLAAQAIPVAGQAIAHLVSYAALAGVICFGPERGGDLTYVLLEDWLGYQPQPLDEARLLARLARRYLEAYGPATAEDFASWAGIAIGQARAGLQAIRSELLEVEIPGSTAWMLEGQATWRNAAPAAPVVRLLPRYDAYLLGYRSRDFMVSEAYARRIHPGGGQIQQCVVLDGCAVAVWRALRRKRQTTIQVEPFEPLSAGALPALKAEVQDMGRFLHQEMVLSVAPL